MRKRIIPASREAPRINQFTGMLSRIGIILIILYFALFFGGFQVAAAGLSFTAPVALVTAASVDYTLPYPGLLPDSPVYFLKVWRDQALLWLTTDPSKKAFYELFLSDKREEAGKMLMDSKKTALGVTTLVQAQSYFLAATDLAIKEKNAGKNVSDLLAKLAVAGAKHEEILGEEMSNVSGKESNGLAKARQDNANDRNRIMELLLVTRH